MKRVTGIGGIFFHARDPATLRAWYQKHLGIDVQEWGGAAFTWTDAEGNHRVADLRGLVAVLKAEGCNVLEKVEESEYGKFAWVIDPEGNKAELREPPPGQ